MTEITTPEKAKKTKQLELILSGLYATVTITAIYVWGVQLNWNLSNLDAFTVFPLLGLVAFSLMWVHYLSGFIRDTWFPGSSTKRTFNVTTIAVLVLILMHPALLITQLFRQGFGLPPGSYKDYVAPGNYIFAIIGMIGLAGLLTFEFRRFFSKKPWWKYVGVISDSAILLIALHSIKLGQHLQSGWFRYLWYFYVLTLILLIARTYVMKLNKDIKK